MGLSIRALPMAWVMRGSSRIFTPPTSAQRQSPLRMALIPSWIATRELEQAVSMATLGPVRFSR
ncbi:hypothetical protein D3C85_1485970 [compost metagenome]